MLLHAASGVAAKREGLHADSMGKGVVARKIIWWSASGERQALPSERVQGRQNRDSTVSERERRAIMYNRAAGTEIAAK